MLTALTQDMRLINLLSQNIDKKGDDYYCPVCRSKVRLKQGKIMRRHFAHVSLKDCQFSTENESSQHLELKSHLYRWLEGQAVVDIEAYLPQIGQIADLLVHQKLALEVQCSSLPIQRLIERTQSYHESDYEALWLLGKDLWLKARLTDLQKQFLRFSQNIGFHLWELDLEKQVLRLRYLIHEDLHGQVQCLSQSFPFGQGKLLSILRLPYTTKSLPSFHGKLDLNLKHYIRKQLYYQTPKWMEIQRLAYEKGENLLTKSLDDFYPQIRLPESKIGFAQIHEKLNTYYKDFDTFYKHQKNKHYQILYSPRYYKHYLGKNKNIQKL